MRQDQAFDAKFNTVVDIFESWLPEWFDCPGATILDFGCDFGEIALGIALKLKPKRVIGIDINAHHKQLPELVQSHIDLDALPDNLEFYQVAPNEKLYERFRFDCIFCWSTLEHVTQRYLHEVVDGMRRALSPKGLAFIQIAPLYYSAFGSHFEALIDEPWAHLTMQDDLFYQTAMDTVESSHYVSGGDHQLQELKEELSGAYRGLNRITADEVIELFEEHGFRTLRQERTKTDIEIPGPLARIFSRDVLETDQIAALFQVNGPDDPDVTDTLATPELLDPLAEQVARLEEQVTQLTERNRYLESHLEDIRRASAEQVARLDEQVAQLGERNRYLESHLEDIRRGRVMRVLRKIDRLLGRE